MSEAEQQRVIGAMSTIETLLGASSANPRPARTIILREHQPGDMGWVTSAHGAIYAREYGWDITFEALVAKITAEFIENFDSRRERCWIAELDGERVGSAFVVRKSDEVAKLRLLIIDPRARGLKLGVRLVDECLRFAKSAGYSSMTLWTQSQSDRGARHLSARGLPENRRRAEPLVRRRSRQRNLGHRALNRGALALFAAAATGVQVGAAITATRYVAADISPASLAFLRYAIGVACLVPFVAMAPRVRFARADILPIAALGIGQFGILIALLNYGLQTVPAGARRADLRELPAAHARSRGIARP